MIARRIRSSPLLTAALIALLAAGCSRAFVAPPPPDVRSIIVLPVNNVTGDDLVVAGASPVEKYVFETPRVTVADLLAADAAERLRARGYQVVASSAGGASASEPAPKDLAAAARMASRAAHEGFALYLEIRRWEPDGSSHPDFVIVGVAATLLEAHSGRVVWTVHPPVHPIRTPGAILIGTAYEIAARAAVAELLASWTALDARAR